MDYLALVDTLIHIPFVQQLSLVVLVITSLKADIKGLRTELHDLKGVFRDQNKRITNVEGTVEAVRYEILELKSEFKNLKKEN